jgi:hypothetical protein
MVDRCPKISQRLDSWPNHLLEDAVGLRIAAGLHSMSLKGRLSSNVLSSMYDPKTDTTNAPSQQAINDAVSACIHQHEEEFISWFDRPPQTNEVGRSSLFVGAMQYLHTEHAVSKFDCYEIGSSGGLNLNMPHYNYVFESESPAAGDGGEDDGEGARRRTRVVWGSAASTVEIKPEMRGTVLPPQSTRSPCFQVLRARGCDLNPVDLMDDEEALRMRAFVWCDHTWRLDQLSNAIAIMRGQASPPLITKANAAEWVRENILLQEEDDAYGSEDGVVARVLMHSIVWQYVDEPSRALIREAMEEAGRAATPERPLAWVAVETNRETFNHELSVKLWKGGSNSGPDVDIVLADAQAHGRWIRWLQHH